MPTRLIEHKGGVFVRGELRRELVEEDLHRLGRQLRQHEGKTLSGGRANGGEQMRPRISLVTQTRRALAAREPAVTHPALLPETCFVLKPERQALAGMLRRDAAEFALKPPFAKASRAAGSALGCDGRAFCRDRPSLRISLDM